MAGVSRRATVGGVYGPPIDVVPRRTRPARGRHHDTKPVLVVDDDEYARLYLGRLLAVSGFSSITAADGEEALGLLAKRKPFLAVLDIDLPGMSGPELGWRIKMDMPATHIVAVSGDYGDWEPDDLMDLGFERLFWKPLDHAEFLGYCRGVGWAELNVTHNSRSRPVRSCETLGLPG